MPRIGTLNGFPFAGVIGAQNCWKDAPYGPKDGDVHFSMWANFGEDVAISANVPEEWERVQKLYDDDVARNASPTNWWYTGICLENQLLDPSQFPELFAIKCFPMYVPVRWRDEGKDDQMWYMPFLVVCTALDCQLVRLNLLGSRGDALKRLIERHFGAERNWNVEVLDADDFVLRIEPTNEIDIAQYVGQDKTVGAQYKQLVNDVKFVYDFSAGRVHGLLDDVEYDLGVVQYVDGDGAQRVASTDSMVVTDLEGEMVDAEDCQAMLAMAYCFETKEAVLSCVSCDYSNLAQAGVADPVQKVLEPLFADLEGDGRTIEKRLIWVNRCGARGMQYFDTCPSFFKESVPDSSVSALEPGLSSLQAKTKEFEVESILDPETKLSCERRIWSLYDFDNLSNAVDLPGEEYELGKYDVVARYADDGKAWLKYVALSSLSGGGGALSGDANWANKNQLCSWSIETKKLSGDVKYHTLWGFQEDPYDDSLQTKLSAGAFTDIVPDLHGDPSVTRELLVRETTHRGAGNSQELKYVDIDLRPPDFKGDADLSALDYSVEGSVVSGDYVASLYNFHGNGQDQNAPLSSAQGRKFYWPQGTQWGTPTSENEYFLTKTVDQTTGETVLKYKRLVVEFPEIEIPDIDALSTWIEQEFYDINV